MKTSECSYCGILTSSDKSICDSCAAAFSVPENFADSGSAEIENFSKTAVDDFSPQFQIKPENPENVFRQSPPADNFQASRAYRTPRPNTPRSSCVLCHRQIPAAQKVCYECGRKKPATKKFFSVFAVLAILAITGIGVYAYKIYLKNSPLTVLKNYASATGAEKMTGIQNLVFKGKVSINLSVAPEHTVMQVAASPVGKSVPMNKTPQARSFNEIYSFEMIMQNPNKSFMAFYKSDPADVSKKEIVYKQAFDGFNGWKYAKMFNQPATLEDAKGDSGQNRPEIFLDNYGSVEFLNDEMKAEYGEINLDSLMSISSFSVDGIETASKERVAIQVVKDNQKTLLVFDKEKSLLLGILRKEVMKGEKTVAKIYVDNYRTITIKGKDSEDITVLTPNRWKFEMHEDKSKDKFDIGYAPANFSKVNVTMSMILDIETTESGSPAEDKLFFKPLSIYTAENSEF